MNWPGSAIDQQFHEHGQDLLRRNGMSMGIPMTLAQVTLSTGLFFRLQPGERIHDLESRLFEDRHEVSVELGLRVFCPLVRRMQRPEFREAARIDLDG